MTVPGVSLEAALVDALARPSDAAFVALHLPARGVSGCALVRAAGATTSFVFDPPDDVPRAGVGAASVVSPVAHASAAQAALALRDVEVRVLSQGAPLPLRAFVAVPFPDQRPVADVLSRGLAFVPRWTLTGEGADATLTFVAPARDCTGNAASQVAEEWRRIAARMAAPRTELGAMSPRLVEGTSRDEYLAMVREAQAEMAAGRLEKVVVARRLLWRTERPVDALALLDRLAEESGPGARVAVQHGGASFVATTPERLVRRRGRLLESEALAGTVDVRSGDTDALRASAKDLREHAVVVEAIRDVLAPLCARLELPDTPRLRMLRQVAHLHTPVRGTLRDDLHVLELARRLHPTPAVGGTPAGAALDWIRAREHAPRGLYAGLVGWFDASGDGDLWVSLRGTTLTNCELEQRVGAGIVAASAPEEEWLETEAKRRALARSLGAES